MTQKQRTMKPKHHEEKRHVDLQHRADFETLMPGHGVPEHMRADFVTLMRTRFERSMPGSVTDDMRHWTKWESRLNTISWQFVARLQWKLPTYAMEIDACVRWLVENLPILDRYTRWAAVCDAGKDGVDLHLCVVLRSSAEITFSRPPIELAFREAKAFVRIENYSPGQRIADFLTDVRHPGVILAAGAPWEVHDSSSPPGARGESS